MKKILILLTVVLSFLLISCGSDDDNGGGGDNGDTLTFYKTYKEKFCEKYYSCDELNLYLHGSTVDECVEYSRGMWTGQASSCSGIDSTKEQQCYTCIEGLTCEQADPLAENNDPCPVCNEVCTGLDLKKK